MRIEYADSGAMIGTAKPRFSWEVRLSGRGRRQSAYQVLVATGRAMLEPGRADMWDSGKVASGESVNVVYGGRALAPNTDYGWTVRVWDEDDQPSEWYAPACFGTALLDEADWQAKWIGMGDPAEPIADPDTFQQNRLAPEVAAIEPDSRAPMMRKAFAIRRQIKRARAYVCGVGLFELHLNGRKVGEDVLATPRTEFRKRLYYSTYDITALLQSGDNVVGLLLGDGWYNGHKRYWGWQQQWYGSPRGLVQLEIEYDNGTTQRITSDGTWQGAWSPITFNCIYDGEHYDARLEQPGWDAPGFDEAAWSSVNEVPAPGGRLQAIPHEPGRITQHITPVAISEPAPGVYVFDMGRNMTGWVRLKVRGEAGRTLTLRYGEAQHPSGALNNSTNNKALQTDRYTLAGHGEETWEPRFTYHGFQYVEVTGWPGEPTLEALTGCFVRTAVQQTGRFECAHPLLNRIHQCTLQSQRCNFQMGVPTDDTQRPERLGWGADAWSFAVEAYYNFAAQRVFAKWIGDFVDQQDEAGMVGMITPQAGAEEDLVWSAAFLLVPWWQYLHFGDRRLLEEIYPALGRYMDYLQRVGVRQVQSHSTDALLQMLRHINTSTDHRYTDEADRGHLQISQWGDHLATHEGSMGARRNQPLSIATAFYHLDAITMSHIAEALGKTDDAAKYRDLAGKIKEAYNQRFFDVQAGYYDVGCQSAQAWALAFGLVPDEQVDRVAGYLTGSVGARQQRFTTGYAGTKWAIRAMADAGRHDILWQRAIATDYPSWGHMLRDPSRTTITENWAGGGSLSHTTLGAAIDEWFFWGLAGIEPDTAGPGFARIILKPYLPPELPWARASMRTVRGLIVSDWQHDGARATWRIVIPANSAATVHVPCADMPQITEGDGPATEAEGVTFLSSGQATSTFAIGSGEYRFAFPMTAQR